MKKTLYLLLAVILSVSLGYAEIAMAADVDEVFSLLNKGQQIPGMSYEFITRMDGTTISGKAWVSGEKVKTDSVMEGERVISIFDGDTVYQYLPSSNMAYKMSVKGMEEQDGHNPTDYTKDLDKDEVVTVENTVYDGKKCKLVTSASKDSKERSKMWLSEDYGIPLKVEYKDSEGGFVVTEYRNIKVGPVPDGIFKLPAGVQVQDMAR